MNVKSNPWVDYDIQTTETKTGVVKEAEASVRFDKGEIGTEKKFINKDKFRANLMIEKQLTIQLHGKQKEIFVSLENVLEIL